ncbi:MAG TPA: right-handed parallel beta-helix repeat-containing protein, partial [Chitinophagaceae bacterium]|nr:right-handed parallel beta-helix repeat-containing protein [Chitinophagaceae bacterium]
MFNFRIYITLCVVLLSALQIQATDYYVNSAAGNDGNVGTSADQPFKSIDKVNSLSLAPGDRVLFAAGQIFTGELRLIGVQGSPLQHIVIDRYPAGGAKFSIDAKGKPNGVLIQDCSYIILKHALIEADGYVADQAPPEAMRVGVMIKATAGKISRHIQIDSVEIKNIYFEKKGFVRGANEVKTENGTQKYGWGIRLMTEHASAQITEIDISHCKIRDVDHTGIKITGVVKNIHWVRIYNNDLRNTGGPGIQMSEVKNVHVHHNSVDRSGSNDDSRKWGRGSGLWTWSASGVLIEHNSFTNA